MTTIDMQNEDIRLLILRIFHRLYLISRLCISKKQLLIYGKVMIIR